MNPTFMLTSWLSFPFVFGVELFPDLDFLLWKLADLSSSFLFLKALKDKVFVVFVFTSHDGLLLTTTPYFQQKLK